MKIFEHNLKWRFWNTLDCIGNADQSCPISDSNRLLRTWQPCS